MSVRDEGQTFSASIPKDFIDCFHLVTASAMIVSLASLVITLELGLLVWRVW